MTSMEFENRTLNLTGAEETSPLQRPATQHQNVTELSGQSSSALSAFHECKDLVLTTLEIRPYAASHGKKKDEWMEVIKSLNSRHRFSGKSIDYIQTLVKKLVAFHDNGPKDNSETVSAGTPKNIFGLSEAALISLGIIERLGDDIAITEEERYTKTSNKRKAEFDEENRGKAIQRIALETRVSQDNGRQILKHISDNIDPPASASHPHRRQQRLPKKKPYLQRTQDGRIYSDSTAPGLVSSTSPLSADNSSLSQVPLSSQTSIPLRQDSQTPFTGTIPFSEPTSTFTSSHIHETPHLPINHLPKLFFDITEPRAEHQQHQLDSIAASTARAVVLLEEIGNLLKAQAHTLVE